MPHSTTGPMGVVVTIKDRFQQRGGCGNLSRTDVSPAMN